MIFDSRDVFTDYFKKQNDENKIYDFMNDKFRKELPDVPTWKILDESIPFEMIKNLPRQKSDKRGEPTQNKSA